MRNCWATEFVWVVVGAGIRRESHTLLTGIVHASSGTVFRYN
ncbi:MAG: hypothetical protein ACNA8P_06250 [Phycisphaerales bacterium]